MVSWFGAAPSLSGGGGFDGEATPLVWATDWGQISGSCVTPGVVWEVSTEGVEPVGCRLSLSVSSCRIELQY
jgi:hypothetical protein